ncbi:RNA polymerase sigma factor [Lutibacter sp.]|uniref:RNA polymerase sigma factor n=1 Tax=Lutibacter sp. TaxID=1925666 RepID=UPI0025C4D86F|nr:RNA polymerase sigma factor [Lutibacter sp.]MCF6167249.1 RNA polymerase sigma factor [Lutibacter sp.]
MSDEELISRILSGDQLYFKILVEKYQSLVLNTCFRFIRDKSDAEDITQEVFIEVFLSIKKFKNKSKLSTWLYRITVNKSLNFIRNNKKRKFFKSIEKKFKNSENTELQIAETPTQNEENVLKQQRLILLREAIELLPEKQKTAFILHKYENVSYKDIAEIMDTSLASIEGLIHRAKINVQKNILKKAKVLKKVVSNK